MRPAARGRGALVVEARRRLQHEAARVLGLPLAPACAAALAAVGILVGFRGFLVRRQLVHVLRQHKAPLSRRARRHCFRSRRAPRPRRRAPPPWPHWAPCPASPSCPSFWRRRALASSPPPPCARARCTAGGPDRSAARGGCAAHLLRHDELEAVEFVQQEVLDALSACRAQRARPERAHRRTLTRTHAQKER